MDLNEQHLRIGKKIEMYQPSKQVLAVIRSTPVVLLVGISGAGKDTIKGKLLATDKYYHIISHTTRSPRQNDGVLEKDGVEYHFITLEQAEAMLDKGEYIEANMYSNNVYGTTTGDIRIAHDTGKVAITDLEVHGVARYMKIDPRVRPIFVLPPSYEIWQKRLHTRHNDTIDASDFKKRMTIALEELEHALATSYFLFVVNDSLGEAVHEVDRLAHGGVVETEETIARGVAQNIARNLRQLGIGR
jgi:guanylate kinase